MERDERIRRYQDGETITSIAKLAGVTRQSVIATLKRAEVHVPSRGGRPKDESGEDISPIKEAPTVKARSTLALPFDVFDLNNEPDKNNKLGRNLFKKGDGYNVFDMHNGGLRSFRSKEDLLNAYGIVAP